MTHRHSRHHPGHERTHERRGGWSKGRGLERGGSREVPALSPRACPTPGGRSGRSLPGGWAAPPMLLCGRRRPSARAEEVQEGGEVWRGEWARAAAWGQVACSAAQEWKPAETKRKKEKKEPRQSQESALVTESLKNKSRTQTCNQTPETLKSGYYWQKVYFLKISISSVAHCIIFCLKIK